MGVHDPGSSKDVRRRGGSTLSTALVVLVVLTLAATGDIAAASPVRVSPSSEVLSLQTGSSASGASLPPTPAGPIATNSFPDDAELRKGDAASASAEPDQIFFAPSGAPGPTSASVALSQDAIITLTGDEGPEGDSGTTTLTFTVRIEGSITWPFTATYRTRGLGEGDPRPPGALPTATPWVDYNSERGSFNLNYSGDQRTFYVEVIGDTEVEGDEFFWFEISSLSTQTYMKVMGVILDDDTAVSSSLSVGDVAVTEGDSGTKAANFKVSLSPAPSSTVTVDYSTCGAGCDPVATATVGEDYAIATGTLTFSPGQTSKAIPVTVFGDTDVEPDEIFFVFLSGATGATITDDQGQGTILNDDAQHLSGLQAVVLGGTGVVSDQILAAIEGLTGTPATRISGADRYATAAAISSLEYPSGAPVAFIAVGDNFPDALAGGVPAAIRGGPVLLVRSKDIPAATAAELARLRPDEIVALGGPGVVSDAVVTQLATYTAGPVSRLAGTDRYRTAVEISKDTFPTGAAVAFLAVGDNFPDALAGGVVAALNDGPILLAQTSTVPATTLTELIRLGVDEIVILGGSGVVSQSVETQLASALPGVAVSRLAGPDRYSTATAISRSQFPAGKGGFVFIAIGGNFPDALAGMPSAARSDAPILLVTRDSLPPSTASEIVRLTP